ncbi:MAG TPA: inositol monophosphatase [Candidatus Marinimicrobia bacterium]|nr:inositol monophosphatase [Candidatus Neomarinimicrobiota bacterium]
MSPLNNESILKIATEAAVSASHIIMDGLGVPRKADYKGRTNLVTDIDLKSEQIIKSKIRAQFPDHDILAEESEKEIMGSDYCWFIDPLDGTTNFIHGYPSFAVSIALFYKNVPLIGVVVEMPDIKIYTAIKDKGAWCEEQSIFCSETPTLEKSLLVTGFGYQHGENWESNMKLFKHFTDTTQGVRRLGAAAVDLCHVASGKVDGFWEFDLKPWDTAAGILIAAEAGAIVSRLDGSDYSIFDDQILASNGSVHKEMIDQIKEFL